MAENKKSKALDKIVVRGARTHNLKNISVEMPREKMIVFTGLSGSGKSSLAFDTIFAEGQRRYVESLSAYARQFLNQMQKPDVDEITGLSPSISIDQKSHSSNPRSTVATITEVYDYLRVLYARIGKPHCLICGQEIKRLGTEEIINFIMDDVKGAVGKKSASIRIFAPLVRGRKGEYYQLLYDLLSKGFLMVRIDGVMHNLREKIELSKTKKHEIDVLVDEILLADFKGKEKGRERLGEAVEKAIDESQSLVRIVFTDKKADIKDFIMSNRFACPNDGFSYPEIEPRLFSFNSPYGACPLCNGLGTKHFFGKENCPDCDGARLRKEALNVFVSGKNIVELVNMSIQDASDFFATLKISARDKDISVPVVKEIQNRLSFMLEVGLNYLTLSRRAGTLSGGEGQRIRLASQLGSRLVGALYVLDEPTIGLHQRDNDRLIKTLKELRDIGNTIIVVEHDEDTIFAADYMVDIGPGAGVHGGEIVVSGDLDELITNTKKYKSLTLDYLRGDVSVPIPKRRDTDKGHLRIREGTIFNIKRMNADIPLGKLVAITGVSGSGKSTFMYELIHKNLQARLERKYRTADIFNCESFTGTEYLSRTVLIDQSAIGRTPRSNPATYTGSFTFMRDLFAETAEARLRGWGPGRFSFNVKGGRCETCEGNGTIAVEMHFLPTVYVTCDVCRGKRFEKDTLEIKYKKKNIYEVLEMTVEEAIKFFEDIPAIYDRLKTLNDVGLGYLKLGQSATTLSGGEAQRVKISSELYRPHVEKTIYLLDEPTVGLHYEDVRKLIEILQKLVDKGNSVILIEHNMDVIKSADYVIDIGPEGGEGGGQIVARGTPEQIAASPLSHTGKYLKKVLRAQKK
ncbi:MAG: Excinuclease ABC, subunit A [Parcubacteria group bacterium GW2011_GWA1_44_13]|uniref:UvrABC system protein A n=1 Tax=Candidatus Nomurabacteria bacterium GW2011_GWB1_44_12 TaxID=1618748 RepID=A0A837I6P1_9BACT|nr:MAG: Excinuclease ABC, subunit A [Candidatus Nomurabacteria bacterium GW2011_GWB1_44_12]KKT38264.1 MAG: Excinuclease ABC, subunit A [Parcubacteria group bacterium GW2011_GWA1_44_13]KKT60476.1 MAG: Excinuclease ABC, subunit A [Parcubacteria group bacterium GW2011_GWC1_44_26]HBB44288.1 excinuclease ABC subunit A [Candidatus Yonathbacteria bacterium]